MEPTTNDRTTWKHYAGMLAFLTAVTIGVPLIATLPLPLAYAITAVLVGIILAITRALARARR